MRIGSGKAQLIEFLGAEGYNDDGFPIRNGIIGVIVDEAHFVDVSIQDSSGIFFVSRLHIHPADAATPVSIALIQVEHIGMASCADHPDVRFRVLHIREHLLRLRRQRGIAPGFVVQRLHDLGGFFSFLGIGRKQTESAGVRAVVVAGEGIDLPSGRLPENIGSRNKQRLKSDGKNGFDIDVETHRIIGLELKEYIEHARARYPNRQQTLYTEPKGDRNRQTEIEGNIVDEVKGMIQHFAVPAGNALEVQAEARPRRQTEANIQIERDRKARYH